MDVAAANQGIFQMDPKETSCQRAKAGKRDRHGVGSPTIRNMEGKKQCESDEEGKRAKAGGRGRHSNRRGGKKANLEKVWIK